MFRTTVMTASVDLNDGFTVMTKGLLNVHKLLEDMCLFGKTLLIRLRRYKFGSGFRSQMYLFQLNNNNCLSVLSTCC